VFIITFQAFRCERLCLHLPCRRQANPVRANEERRTGVYTKDGDIRRVSHQKRQGQEYDQHDRKKHV
jgi:hypothetical protein